MHCCCCCFFIDEWKHWLAASGKSVIHHHRRLWCVASLTVWEPQGPQFESRWNFRCIASPAPQHFVEVIIGRKRLWLTFDLLISNTASRRSISSYLLTMGSSSTRHSEKHQNLIMCRAVIWTRTGWNRSKLLRLPLLTVTPVLLLPFYSDSVQQLDTLWSMSVSVTGNWKKALKLGQRLLSDKICAWVTLWEMSFTEILRKKKKRAEPFFFRSHILLIFKSLLFNPEQCHASNYPKNSEALQENSIFSLLLTASSKNG